MVGVKIQSVVGADGLISMLEHGHPSEGCPLVCIRTVYRVPVIKEVALC